MEVTKLYINDRGKIGSSIIERESSNDRELHRMAIDYYNCRKDCPILVRLQGVREVKEYKGRVLEIIKQRKWHGNWNRRSYTLNNSPLAKLLVEDLPIEAGNYIRWQNISDNGGYVKYVKNEELQEVVDDKALKLPIYLKSYDKIDLLIVCHRVRNSGRVAFNDNTVSPSGFNKVYFFEYPFNVYNVNLNLN